MAFTPITVTGTYHNEDGTAASGSVTFQLTAAMQDTVSHIIQASVPVTVALDATGYFSISLAANDDTNTSPSGVGYQVTERILNSAGRTYTVVIPHTASGGTVDLSTLAPATATANYQYLLATTAQATYGSGELGYAERTSFDTTTNTNSGLASSNKISGLSVTVVGQGLPVRIEFFCPYANHSVSGQATAATLLINGSSTGGQTSVAESTVGEVLVMIRRLVLTAGTSYTFEVGKWITAAGTGNYLASADLPMHLAVTR